MTIASSERMCYSRHVITKGAFKSFIMKCEKSPVQFRIVGEIINIQVIARGSSVRIRRYLNEEFGHGRWRKMKGEALIEWDDGRKEYAEVHWFEAQGIGRALMKRKRGLGR